MVTLIRNLSKRCDIARLKRQRLTPRAVHKKRGKSNSSFLAKCTSHFPAISFENNLRIKKIGGLMVNRVVLLPLVSISRNETEV